MLTSTNTLLAGHQMLVPAPMPARQAYCATVHLFWFRCAVPSHPYHVVSPDHGGWIIR